MTFEKEWEGCKEWEAVAFGGKYCLEVAKHFYLAATEKAAVIVENSHLDESHDEIAQKIRRMND